MHALSEDDLFPIRNALPTGGPNVHRIADQLLGICHAYRDSTYDNGFIPIHADFAVCQLAFMRYRGNVLRLICKLN